VSDSGEGRWTVLAAVDEGVPATIIATSLMERFESRRLGEYTDKILSAMRSELGGHAEKRAEKKWARARRWPGLLCYGSVTTCAA
jgi:6-phosphogluconate dehydrogenase